MLAGFYILAIGLIMGVPLAPIAALWMVLTDLIPQIGGFLGGAFFTILAVSQSVTIGVVCLVLYLIYMNLENHVISPPIVGEAVDLSPPTTMLAALVGGAAGGIPGALFATPLAGAVKQLYLEFRFDRTTLDDKPRRTPIRNLRRPSRQAKADYFLTEHRRALLDERAHRFCAVAAHRREHLRAVLELDRGFEARRVEVRPDHLLGQPHRERTVGDDRGCDLERGVDQLLVGHDTRHEADAFGFDRVERTSGEEELERPRRTDRSAAAGSSSRTPRPTNPASPPRRGSAPSCAAMRMSEPSASARPAPAAGPLTAAITGWRSDRNVAIIDEKRS